MASKTTDEDGSDCSRQAAIRLCVEFSMVTLPQIRTASRILPLERADLAERDSGLRQGRRDHEYGSC